MAAMSQTSGEHKPNGILLAYGHGIRKGSHVEGARIIDMAPTILYALGEKIPRDMDGKVLKEIFREDSEFTKREVVYHEVDEREEVKERIKRMKSLGKI